MTVEGGPAQWAEWGRKWGIAAEYWDTLGHHHPTSPETCRAILAAMGVEPEGPGPPPVRVLGPGQSDALAGPGELILEDGTSRSVEGPLPGDLPVGYHQFAPAGGGPPVRVIKRPATCYPKPGGPTAGWAVQLYALRSRQSWGIGDLADLRRFSAWARSLRFGAVLINPLGAVAPVVPQQPSPYYPGSRRFANPLYLRVPEVPGAGQADLDWEGLAAAARRLNDRRAIDRDAVFHWKMEALGQLWSQRRDEPDFERFCRQQGEELQGFATYCALAERFGGDWRDWPGDYRRPEAPAVAEFARDHADRVRFHQWLQWLLDGQLGRAATELPLVGDLPIGVDPGGADAWLWQDLLASAVRVGAPPDPFNARGQDWNLPPFVPHRLQACGYRPFIQTVRAALRHAGGLRIDHVMGLFRLFWIPEGTDPAGGVYVRYPAEQLLAILAVESHRAGAWIAGEDLGTVEPEVRQRLAQERILTYRLLWFESAPPKDFPPPSMAAVTTHDLPTIAGLWSGSDLADQQRLGLNPDAEGYRGIRRPLEALTGLPPDAPVEAVVRRTYQVLAQAPSALRVANLDDALLVHQRTNMPGTREAWPNWSRALSLPLEAIVEADLPRAIAHTLAGNPGS